MRYLIVFLTLLFATPLWAQDDRGLLQSFLEDKLSGAGREVRIEGFAGALSSTATLDRLTIADAQGVWVTLEGATLDWSRAALLRGRLEVRTLSADAVVLSRRPLASGVSPKDAQATPFALPQLPVSIAIDQIQVDRVSLGADVIGVAADVSVAGRANLADGAGSAALRIARLDGPEGLFDLSASYANDSRELALSLDLSEARGGLAATLLNLPGRPSLTLAISGDDPLSDFRADLRLETDNELRLSGQVALREEAGEGASTRLFSGDLGGDISPLFTPQLRPFFGRDTALRFRGERRSDGTLSIGDFAINAAALTVSGGLEIAPDGLPSRFDLQAVIEGDGPTVLPVSGPAVSVQKATLNASFNAAQGDEWQATVQMSDYLRDGFAVSQADLQGRGMISRAGTQAVTAQLQAALQGIAPPDAALATALGPSLTAGADLAWQAGAPLSLRTLDVAGAGLAAQIVGQADATHFTGKMVVQADQIARFSGVAGRPLAGGAEVLLSGTADYLGGAFDIELMAFTDDLSVGEARVDPLLSGPGTVLIDVVRDTSGTTLRDLFVATDMVEIAAEGTLSATAGALTTRIDMVDISGVDPSLSGPAEFSGNVAWQDGQPVKMNDVQISAAGAAVQADGALEVSDTALNYDGALAFSAADLSQFATLLQRPVAGRVSGRIDGRADLRALSFDGEAKVTGAGLVTGVSNVDPLITGDLAAEFRGRVGPDTVLPERFEFTSNALNVSASGDGPVLTMMARLANLGTFVPQLPGAATLNGTVSDLAGTPVFDLAATGPGGIAANAAGDLDLKALTTRMTTRGSVPLSVLGALIEPRSISGDAVFDLALNGPLELSSVAGSVAVRSARVTLPSVGAALQDVDADITLSDARAMVSADGKWSTGGRVSLRGPIALGAPLSTDLQITLDDLILRDPSLYQTEVDGTLTLSGPISAAMLRGALTLDKTEMKIPSGTGAVTAEIPDGLIHVNEPAGVRKTRSAAGLLQQNTASAGGAIGLDIAISAPNRIFVRGRGLDAELGGALRVTGTTAEVIPSGQFDLVRGRMDILGKRLTLSEGLIRLEGAMDPFLRLVATTQAQDVAVNVAIEGPASVPQIRFSSQPELPEDEVLAQLLFGRSAQSLSPLQAAQLAAAVATLAGRNEGLVARLRQNLGLDDLDVATDGSGDTSLRVGKYLADNVYSDVTVNSAGESTINLNLDLTNTLTATGSVDSDGNSSVGLYWSRDY